MERVWSSSAEVIVIECIHCICFILHIHLIRNDQKCGADKMSCRKTQTNNSILRNDHSSCSPMCLTFLQAQNDVINSYFTSFTRNKHQPNGVCVYVCVVYLIIFGCCCLSSFCSNPIPIPIPFITFSCDSIQKKTHNMRLFHIRAFHVHILHTYCRKTYKRSQ